MTAPSNTRARPKGIQKHVPVRAKAPPGRVSFSFYLQQDDPRRVTGRHGALIPQGHLHLADMGVVPIRPRPDGHKAHIGEVQASPWDESTMAACDASGIILL